jgi:hypothetical protein
MVLCRKSLEKREAFSEVPKARLWDKFYLGFSPLHYWTKEGFSNTKSSPGDGWNLTFSIL